MFESPFSIPAALGAGDNQFLFTPTTATVLGLYSGYAAAPDTSENPPFKVSRTTAINPASSTANSLETQCAILGITVGVTPNKIQATGGVFAGIQQSTTVDTRNDALGAAGFGWVQAAGSVNAAEGIYAATRRSISTARAVSQEIQVQEAVSNQTYSSVGYQTSQGMSINPGVSASFFDAAAAIIIARSGVPAFDVGLAFPAFAASGDGIGACRTANITMDNNPAWGLKINGAPTSGAIQIGNNSGAVIVGRSSQFVSSNRLEVWMAPGGSATPLIEFGDPSGAGVFNMSLRNSAASYSIGMNASGVMSFTANTAGKLANLGDGATPFLSWDSTDKGSFFGATVVAQQATTGTSTGFTAGGGTTATSLSTFTGGVGSKAYTVGDIVLALKNLGLMATS